MASENQNLWPDDLFTEDSEKSPFAILKEQAAQLTRASNGKLRGQVEREVGPYTHGFSYGFGIHVPALEYTYDLFRLTQRQLDFYPLEYRFEDERGTIDSEQHLYTWMGRIFSSETTKRIVRRLLAQAKG